MSELLNQHTMEIRVRYSETDSMQLLHHSNYLTYFEMGRTELFRAQGGSYRKMEALGLFFVVARVNVSFKKPARYDDVLTLTTSIRRQTPAKLEHDYVLKRGDELLTAAESVIACVNQAGEVQRIPENLIDITGSCKL
ncbi:MAG: thioesterase family protein [Fuerstiella sp.]